MLTGEALDFLAELHRRFDSRRRDLLAARAERQKAFDAGALPDFLPETREIREGDWQIGGIPADLLDRRVEITGPTDRKMVINALNSGAKVFMADFEDATAPTWANLVEGQVNLLDRWQNRLFYSDPASGKSYALGDDPAVLMVRPRGWHLDERHLRSRASRSPAACSISASMSGTMPKRRSRPAPAPISICPSSKATARRPCGATSSPSPRRGSASLAARSR